MSNPLDTLVIRAVRGDGDIGAEAGMLTVVYAPTREL
jgi:hypothetical protein